MCICIFNDLVKPHHGCVLLIRLLKRYTAMICASNWFMHAILYKRVLLEGDGVMPPTLSDYLGARDVLQECLSQRKSCTVTLVEEIKCNQSKKTSYSEYPTKCK